MTLSPSGRWGPPPVTLSSGSPPRALLTFEEEIQVPREQPPVNQGFYFVSFAVYLEQHLTAFRNEAPTQFQRKAAAEAGYGLIFIAAIAETVVRGTLALLIVPIARFIQGRFDGDNPLILATLGGAICSLAAATFSAESLVTNVTQQRLDYRNYVTGSGYFRLIQYLWPTEV